MIITYRGHRLSTTVQNDSRRFRRSYLLQILKTAQDVIKIYDKDTFPMINRIIKFIG